MDEILLNAPIAGWVMPLGDVPDAVFAEGLMGQGVGIDPVGGVVHAPCAATVAAIHRARHALTLAIDDGPELLIHVGIDTVALDGGGFTPLVSVGARVAAGAALMRFDLDRIVREASAAVTPVIVVGEGWRVDAAQTGRLVAAGDPLLRLVRERIAAQATATGDTAARHVAVGLPHGLHARPAARIVAAARAHGVTATLTSEGCTASCASPTALLALGLPNGADVTIAAQGDAAAAAVDAIADLLAREVEGVAPPPRSAATPDVVLPTGALAGVPAAPGIVIGTALRLRPSRAHLPDAGEGVAVERARLAAGLAEAARAIDADYGLAGGIRVAHGEIVADPALGEAAGAAVDAGVPAARAIVAAAEAQAQALLATGNARIAERADDIRDVADRVAHAILGTVPQAAPLPAGAIVLADELLPSQFAALDRGALAGITLACGGPTSHVAILAAGLGVPMIVAVGAALDTIEDGTTLILDADAGHLIVDPDPAARDAARGAIARQAEAIAAAREGAGRTADGVAIRIQANLGSEADALAAAVAGAEGSGLVRTEFLFLDRATPPDAGEQAGSYSAIAAALPSGSLTFRLLDVGGDKPAPYLAFAPEENPALGLRGVRVSLARPDLLDAQLEALISFAGADRCRIMVPMVAAPGELAAVRAALIRVCAAHGVDVPPLGAMVETPAAALTADTLAAHADFLSIGSNDLTQYALAMDRGNAAVAGSIDGLHPAVLRLVHQTCVGAARHGVPVGVCGGLAADPLAVPILLGLGVASLSVPPARVVPVRALVATLSLAAARVHAAAVLDCTDAAAVRARARSFAGEGFA